MFCRLYLYSHQKLLLTKSSGLSTKKLNPAIEDSKLQKSKGFTKFKFSSGELISEMNCFLSMLGEIGMDTEDKKSK